MARTVYFLDGTREVLLSEDVSTELERIIQEKLGDDAVELFKEFSEVNIALEDELKSYETSCENYRNLLEDVREHLRSIQQLAKSLNHPEISQSAHSLIVAINNPL